MLDKSGRKLCARSKVCKKSGLSLMVLASAGCHRYGECDEFFEMKEKIKERVVTGKFSCTAPSCHRDSREKVKDDCVDCRSIQISEEGKSLEFQTRCVNEYCYKGKKVMDIDCFECIEGRVHSVDKASWVAYRGGKDIKGRSL